MHPLATSNLTYVVFGVLPDPSNASMSLLPLSILRSSLIELVLQQLNLTLTQSIFGQPSSFEVLKFPGGITLIPGHSPPIWQRPQILFNFMLNNSISQIHENADRLKDQLKYGLQLRIYEVICYLHFSAGKRILLTFFCRQEDESSMYCVPSNTFIVFDQVN